MRREDDGNPVVWGCGLDLLSGLARQLVEIKRLQKGLRDGFFSKELQQVDDLGHFFCRNVGALTRGTAFGWRPAWPKGEFQRAPADRHRLAKLVRGYPQERREGMSVFLPPATDLPAWGGGNR